jgi:prepilin-type N-terminal cleavage/methylation domain-containing protein
MTPALDRRAVHNLFLLLPFSLSRRFYEPEATPHAQSSRLQVRCSRLHRSLTSLRAVRLYEQEADFPRGRRTLWAGGRPLTSGFTLIELMVVIAIIAILMALVVPAFTTMKSAGDVTSAAYTIKGVLDQARTYAMANNTYTWVGFYEEATTAASPTNATPPYSGTGRLLLAMVASKDGTKIYDENGDPPGQLPNDRISQLGKLIKVEGAHITDIGAPNGGSADTLAGRSNLPYTNNFYRVNSDSTDTVKFWFLAQNYLFYKAIRFSPSGEANLLYQSSTYTLTPVGEIGMKPTHGDLVDTISPNVVAIQFTGVSGNVKIYRR